MKWQRQIRRVDVAHVVLRAVSRLFRTTVFRGAGRREWA